MIREHLNDKDQPKMAFDSFFEALGYINIHHLKDVAPYKCMTCGKYHFGHSDRKDEQYQRHLEEMNDVLDQVRSLSKEIEELKSQNFEKDAEINKLKIQNKNYTSLLEENSEVLQMWTSNCPEVSELYKLTKDASDKWMIKYLKSLLPKKIGNTRLYVFGRENCFKCVYRNKTTGSFEIDTGWKKSKVEALQCMVDAWKRVQDKYGSQE